MHRFTRGLRGVYEGLERCMIVVIKEYNNRNLANFFLSLILFFF